ncbi:MAG: DUF192 domain-containing protein [Proteobacteria bacterium]|nr:DUF192 domain-containing protein [Pseudomonadota bacterium]
MRVLPLLTAVFLTLPVCACAADPQPPAKPLPHTILVIDTTAGEATFNVEVAADWRSQEYGLMNRKSLPRHTGMIFDFGSPSMTSFWMKNTLIPLDMIFIRQDGTISSVAPDAVPMSLDSIPSTEPVRAVLEIGGGEAARLGIYPGQKVHNAIFGNAIETH